MAKETQENHPFGGWLESESWKSWKSIGLTGLKGSSKACLLSHWRERVKGSLLVIVPQLEDAESLLEDLRFFQDGKEANAFVFPPWDTLPYDEIPPHPEIIRERVTCLFSLLRGEEAVVISPVRALMQKVLSPINLKGSTLSLSAGKEADRDHLVHFLNENGYTSVRIVEERGDFSLRGGIIDVYAPLYEEPLRFEFDGDRLESIRRFETESQRSLAQNLMDEAILLPAKDISKDFPDRPLATLFDYLKGKRLVFVEEGDDVEREEEAFSRLIREHYEKALSKKGSIPAPELIYLNQEDVSLALDQFQTIFLQEGPIAPPQCQHLFSFEMESNEDLQREIKANLSGVAPHAENSPFSILLKNLRDWKKKGMGVFIVSHTLGQAERLRDLLSNYEMESHLERLKTFREAMDQPQKGILLLIGPLSSGFQNPQEGWVLLTEEEIFGERRRLRVERAK